MEHPLCGEESHRMRKYSWVVAVAVAIPVALMGVDLLMWQRERSVLEIEATAPQPSILVAPAWAATASEGPAIKGPEVQWNSELTLPSRNVSLAQGFNSRKERRKDADDEGAGHARIESRVVGAAGRRRPEHRGGGPTVGHGRSDAFNWLKDHRPRQSLGRRQHARERRADGERPAHPQPSSRSSHWRLTRSRRLHDHHRHRIDPLDHEVGVVAGKVPCLRPEKSRTLISTGFNVKGGCTVAVSPKAEH